MKNSLNQKLPSKKIVYYDGSCPMCTALVRKIDSSSEESAFSLQDIQTCPLPASITKADVEKEIYVVSPEGKEYTNADGILEILNTYPRWRFLAFLGRLPILRNLLPLGYNFVASNRHFFFGKASRVFWIKTTVVFGLLFGIALSPKLWLTERYYPLSPLGPIPFPLSAPFDEILLTFLIVVLIFSLFSAKPKKFLWLAVALLGVLFIFDQSRIQPWAFQYISMLGVLGWFSWKHADEKGQEEILDICRFILACIYFWSGLQKVNPEFLNSVFPWMLEPLSQKLPGNFHPFFVFFASLVPFIEMGIGIGLLVKKLRGLAIFFSGAMCAFVLFVLGPLGHDWNSVVWPWNIVMLILVLLLFWKTNSTNSLLALLRKNSVLPKFIFVIFGILPLFNFFNAWDSYLSFSLYSGTINRGFVLVSDSTKNRLPPFLQSLVQKTPDGENIIDILRWSFEELNVPPYPESRIFKNVGQSLCHYADKPADVKLFMTGHRPWFNQERPATIDCSQLK